LGWVKDCHCKLLAATSNTLAEFLLDSETAQVIYFLVSCQVSLDETVCVEEFSNCRVLGRVFLRAAGNTIAVGVVTRVLQPETVPPSAP